MKALLLINAKSGAVSSLGPDAIAEAARNAVVELDNVSLEILSGDYETLHKRAANTHQDERVLCAGGDGTQAGVAGDLIKTGAALAPLPCGTVNLFCRDLGVPLDIPSAIESGLTAPLQAIDVGRVGDRIFVNNVVFGAYAALAEAREDIRDAENADDLSFGLLEAADALINADALNFTIDLDGKAKRVATNTLVVSNNDITGAEQLVPKRARLDAGVLAAYLSQAQDGFDFAALLASFARGEAELAEGVELMHCNSCVVSSHAESFSYTIDGDPIETSQPVRLSIIPAALKVVRPDGDAGVTSR